jgi:hypothetical protein
MSADQGAATPVGSWRENRETNCAPGSQIAVKSLNHPSKVVLSGVYDAQFAAGVLLGVTCVSGVDHDRLAELAPD